MNIQENVPLAPLTTFKVGGPARYFVEPTTISEASESIQFARSPETSSVRSGGRQQSGHFGCMWPGWI